MYRRILTAVMVAAVLGVVAVMGILPTYAQSTPSASRSFDSASGAPGGTVTVTITASDYGQAGGVTETLPPGFSYVGSSLDSSQVTELGGNQVRFTLQGETSFTYSVTASDTPGSYEFKGMLRDFARDDHIVGGATMVTVTAPTPSASRSFDSASVAPGGTVTVTITASDYGQAGGVTETLPPGFSYVGSSLASSQVTELGGNQVRFTLQDETSFTYTVTASDTPGSYSFSGTLRDFDRNDHTVGGVNAIRVGSPPTDVTDDPCLDALSVDGAVNEVIGEWNSDCESTARDSYARYYSFTLDEESTVIITLKSSIDPYLYLRAGEAKSGTAAYENDDVVPGTDTNSEIEATLGAGTYTIEATTYGAGEMGSFTLGVGTVTIPGPSDDPCLDALSVDGPVIGEWSSDCESTARGSYARYYRFTLDEESTVIITLKSSIDPYLYLRAGAAKSGTAAYENDDVVPGTDTNSEIEATLGAGTYTIEATTYGAEETGSFTLGVGTVTIPGPSDDPCLDALSVDGPVIGEWSSDCESTARGSYARYYRFTLDEESTVIITLKSSIDPYLYLREGAAKSGTAVHENDDVVPGTDTNSEIEATLGAGTYTIEATTYGAGEMGSFTLTVSGL